MNLAERLAQVRDEMAAACTRAGRPENAVRLMAVTKTQPVERVREALELGIDLLGENRVQEAEAKIPGLGAYGAEWHLIGPLQANKVARALKLFSTIQTVDRVELARRLDRLARELGQRCAVLLEVNLGREAQKSGVLPEDAAELAKAVRACSGLRLRGLMAIPPAGANAEAQRPYFIQLRELGEKLRTEQPGSSHELRWELSMGMSLDFGVAIEEGATLVRLGTALFGPRDEARAGH